MNAKRSTGESDHLPTRPSLLQRLKNWDDNASWNDFKRIYSRFLHGIAMKSGLTETEADDVVQETMISVAKSMPGFNYDPAAGSFRGWLALFVRRRVADCIRKRHYHANGVAVPKEQHMDTTVFTNQPAANSSPLEAQWQEEWSLSVLEVATAKVKGRVRNLQYQMFHLHVVKGLPVAEVEKLLGVKFPQVYFAKYKVSKMMKQEIKRLERELL